MNVYVAGQRVALSPAAAIGQGGEAEVYDMGGGRALKVFKGPGHADFAGHPQEQDAARKRLDLHQRKLPDFPAGLPERVIAPEALATGKARGGAIVGYAMRLVAGAEVFAHHAEPRVRRQMVPGNRIADLLRDLHDTVDAVHRAGVIIGDFNDHNVLACGSRAYLIDADSFQFGAYPCVVFTERFVDPLLCDAQATAPVLCRRYTVDSDWYAFHVMAMRALLAVGPYGGVHRPKDPARRVPHAARPLRRVTVFDPEVVYPRPALPWDLLPDALLDRLRDVFCQDRRGPMPRALLDDLRWTGCRRCGSEHARDTCPRCRAGIARQKRVYARIRGRLRVDELATVPGMIVDARRAGAGAPGGLAWLALSQGVLRDHTGAILASGVDLRPGRRVLCWPAGALVIDGGHARILPRPGADARAPGVLVADTCGHDTAVCAGDRHLVWASNGRLLCWRAGTRPGYAPADLGAVLPRQTRLWLGDALGFGFYRAGAMTVGFVFDPARRGLDDGVELPVIRGRIAGMHATVGRDRVWLFWREQRQAREVARCALIAASGALLATAEADSAADTAPWLLAGPGSAAVGPYLFVPTDAGIARIEASGSALSATRLYPDTEPWVSAGSRLLPGPDGLYAIGADRILRLTLT